MIGAILLLSGAFATRHAGLSLPRPGMAMYGLYRAAAGMTVTV